MDTWTLRRAVLPVAIAYAAFLVLLIAGARSAGRPPGPRPSPWHALASVALGGYAAFGLLVGTFCVAQTDRAGCIVPALREAAGLMVMAVTPGLALLSAASRAYGLRGSRRRLDE